MNHIRIIVFRCICLLVAFLWIIVKNVTGGTNTDPDRIIISGKFENGEKVDTISLMIWNPVLSKRKRILTVTKEFTTVAKDNSFSFRIDSIPSPIYITIGRYKIRGSAVSLFDPVTAEPGDSIFVKIEKKRALPQEAFLSNTDEGISVCFNCDTFLFSGRGAGKYQCAVQLQEKYEQLLNDWDDLPISQPYLQTKTAAARLRCADITYKKTEFVVKGLMRHLDQQKKNMSPLAYNYLKTDIYGVGYLIFFALAREEVSTLLNFYKDASIYDLENFKSDYIKAWREIKLDIKDQHILARSFSYADMLIAKESLEALLFGRGTIYSNLKEHYKAPLRDRLMTNFLLDRNDLPRIDSLLSDAISTVENSQFRAALFDMLNRQKIGTPFYPFEMPDSSGNIIRLADFRGKIIFIDFWFVGCGGCIQYFANCVSKVEEIFKNDSNVVFITIAIDDIEKWKAALRSGKYTSSLAINLHTAGLGLTHPVIEQLKLIAYPHPIILDREGHILINDGASLRSLDALTASIKSAIAL